MKLALYSRAKALRKGAGWTMSLKRTRIAAGGAAIAVVAALIAGCSSSSTSSAPAAAANSSAAGGSSPSAVSSASTSAGASNTRMAIFDYNPSPYGIASLNGAKREAAKLGIQLDAFDGNNNPQTQTTQIQDAITTGKYKAFWVWGLDDIALTPTINKAIAAGIKVAAADYTWGPLSAQNVLTANPKFVTTIGQSVGSEATKLIGEMNAVC